MSTFENERLLRKMEPKIRKTLRHVPARQREDVEQDVKLKVIEASSNLRYSDVPGFFRLAELVKEEEGAYSTDTQVRPSKESPFSE
ncbi:hypothetical protein [Shouchella shacheensis]|uniref:hypothetical protein n=1 Tax=Shouchella shacheensis TaxID=1649580 RepID=UPI00073FFCC3|nr:hypothetical protein [Shouchella shacheensis]